MRENELLIIIPVHNEAENLPGVLRAMTESNIPATADILLINDASEDATADIIARERYSSVTNVFCLGYGGAIQVGYKYAARMGYEYLIQMDGDGQHDVCNIPVLYDRLRGEDRPDIVLGSRYLEGSQTFPLSPAKRLAHRLFRLMIRAATGQVITDPTTGLQGLSRRAFSSYARYDNFDVRYPDANMLIQMLLLRYRVVEAPAVMHSRAAGTSIHSGWKPLWYMMRMVFSTLAVVYRIKVLKGGVPDGSLREG